MVIAAQRNGVGRVVASITDRARRARIARCGIACGNLTMSREEAPRDAAGNGLAKTWGDGKRPGKEAFPA